MYTRLLVTTRIDYRPRLCLRGRAKSLVSVLAVSRRRKDRGDHGSMVMVENSVDCSALSAVQTHPYPFLFVPEQRKRNADGWYLEAARRKREHTRKFDEAGVDDIESVEPAGSVSVLDEFGTHSTLFPSQERI